MSLREKARSIVENQRHARHSWRTIYVVIEYVADTDVNCATRRINELRAGSNASGIPRWLVKRWATDADLVDPTPTYT